MIGARAPEMMIPVEDSFAAWRNDPKKYVAAYNALEDEFSRAAATGMRLRISIKPTPAR
jgi:hypothetical protein